VITGNCGDLVACKTSDAKIKIESGKTAKKNDYHFTTHVSQFELYRCIDTCKTYCVKEGVPGIKDWPNCKAFSSYVEVGGTCHCYGWNTEPSWYADEDYNAGWCEN